MTRYRDFVRTAVLATVLTMSLFSWAPEALFSSTGEQLSAGVPLSTVVLLLGLATLFASSSSRPFPLLPWPVAIAVMSGSFGLLGTHYLNLGTTAKELIQLGEITLVAVWLVQFGTRWHVRSVCVGIFGALELLLLLLGASGQISLLGLSQAKWGAFVIVAAPFAVLWIGRRFAWLTMLPGVLVGLTFDHAGPMLVWCGAVLLTSVSLGRRHLLALLAIPLAIGISVLPGRSQVWERLNSHYDANHLKRSVIELRLAGMSPYRLPFGAGPGQYKAAINRLRAYETTEPHPEDKKVPRDGNSQYAITLVESGVLGLLGFVLMLAMTAAAAFGRQPRNTPNERQDRIAVACAVVACAGAGVFAVTVSRGLGIWLGILLGLAYDPVHLPNLRSRLVRVIACWGTVAVLLGLSLALNTAGARNWPSQANRALGSLYGVPVTASGLRIVDLPDEYATDSNDVVIVEAEDAYEIMAPFVVANMDGASGGAAVAIPEGSGKGIGRLALRIAVPTAGRYVLLARVSWSDGCGNSIALRVGRHEVHLADDLYGRWHQVEGAVPLDLPAGELTVEALNLEDGVMLDFVGLRFMPEAATTADAQPE